MLLLCTRVHAVHSWWALLPPRLTSYAWACNYCARSSNYRWIHETRLWARPCLDGSLPQLLASIQGVLTGTVPLLHWPTCCHLLVLLRARGAPRQDLGIVPPRCKLLQSLQGLVPATRAFCTRRSWSWKRFLHDIDQPVWRGRRILAHHQYYQGQQWECLSARPNRHSAKSVQRAAVLLCEGLHKYVRERDHSDADAPSRHAYRVWGQRNRSWYDATHPQRPRGLHQDSLAANERLWGIRDVWAENRIETPDESIFRQKNQRNGRIQGYLHQSGEPKALQWATDRFEWYCSLPLPRLADFLAVDHAD